MDDILNTFILEYELVDIYFGGYNFMWSNLKAFKTNMFDRCFQLEGILDNFLNLYGIIIDLRFPDDRPIALREDVTPKKGYYLEGLSLYFFQMFNH